MKKRGETACSWHVLARSPLLTWIWWHAVNVFVHSCRNRCQKASGASSSLIKIGRCFHKLHIYNYASERRRWRGIACSHGKALTTRRSSLAPEPWAIWTLRQRKMIESWNPERLRWWNILFLQDLNSSQVTIWNSSPHKLQGLQAYYMLKPFHGALWWGTEASSVWD